MRIDCDTHYWPIDFLERVDHPGKGRIEREDETTVSFYRAGELVHRFRSTRWDLAARKAVMDKEGFDVQVLIPDNRPFLYELANVLGRLCGAGVGLRRREPMVASARDGSWSGRLAASRAPKWYQVRPIASCPLHPGVAP